MANGLRWCISRRQIVIDELPGLRLDFLIRFFGSGYPALKDAAAPDS
jgi:hypothetical protein